MYNEKERQIDNDNQPEVPPYDQRKNDEQGHPTGHSRKKGLFFMPAQFFKKAERDMGKKKIIDHTDEKCGISENFEVVKLKPAGDIHGPLRIEIERAHRLMMHGQPEKTEKEDKRPPK